MKLKRSKYGNKKTTIDGIVFDSKKEAKRYCELKILERAKQISKLELQRPFNIEVNGAKVCKYVCDFYYLNTDGVPVIEDCKGFKTATYRLKKKLMRAVYEIEILET